MAVAADLVSVTHRSSTIDVFGGSVVGLIVRRDVDMIRDLVRHRVDFDQRYGGPIGGMSHAVLRIHHAMQHRHRQKSGAQKDAEGTNRSLQTGSPTCLYSRCDAQATGAFETDRRAGRHSCDARPAHRESGRTAVLCTLATLHPRAPALRRWRDCGRGRPCYRAA